MRTNSIFIAHVAEAIGSPLGGGRAGGADFPGFTPWPSAGHGPTASVTRTGEPNMSVQSTSRAACPGEGRSRSSAADEAATCGVLRDLAQVVVDVPVLPLGQLDQSLGRRLQFLALAAGGALKAMTAGSSRLPSVGVGADPPGRVVDGSGRCERGWEI